MLMMTGDGGNLKAVRDALSELQIGDVVDYGPINPLSAEIVPGLTPAWHVLETLPNHERSVAAHLIGRRFGVFIPETEEDIVRRGRKLHVTRLMFTGYVFVFVWGIEAHASRLESIPGVARIMRHPVPDGQFFARAVTISDKLIDRIRAVENQKRPLTITIADDAAQKTSKKKKKGRWRRARKAPRNEPKWEIIAVRPWDAFQDGIATLDAEGRNQALLHALGLSS